MQVWMNGQYLDHDKAVIPVTDRGFLLGDGIFETMRAHKGAVAMLQAHIERLAYHSKQIGFPEKYLPTAQEVADIIQRLSQQSQAQNAVVRLTVSRGSGARGLLPETDPSPTVLVTVAPFDPIDPNVGATLSISQKVRRNAFSVAGSIKSINYLDNIIARQEAQLCGADDAVILAANGYVAETTISNIFAIKDKALWTPHQETGILCGLMRSFVLESVKDSGLAIKHDHKTPDDLKEFDVVFTTNALQGLRLVDCVDGYVINRPVMRVFTELSQKAERMLCNSIVI